MLFALPFATIAFELKVIFAGVTVAIASIGGSGSLLVPKKSATIIVEALLWLVQIASPPQYLFTILV